MEDEADEDKGLEPAELEELLLMLERVNEDVRRRARVPPLRVPPARSASRRRVVALETIDSNHGSGTPPRDLVPSTPRER